MDAVARDATEVVSISRRLGVDYRGLFWCTTVLGVCSWAYDDREGLARSIDDVQNLVGSTNDPALRIQGDFLNALATTGDTETTGPLRQHLRRCATGQLASGESDAIVILAAIAEAEGDIDRARTLITTPNSPSATGQWHAKRLLAERLGVIDEVHERRRVEVTDGYPSINLEITKQTLRTELQRRYWLD